MKSKVPVDGKKADDLLNRKKEYISSPNTCPWCGGDQLESDGPIEIDGCYAWSYIDCTDCDVRFVENYILHSIEEVEK